MATVFPQHPLVLVDGSSYLYRAFHAAPALTNSHGEATGAIYGVINMLRSLQKQYQPERVVVVFDAKGPTFRDEMYSEYKANRDAMPDDLRTQVEPLHAIIRAMGYPLVCMPGVEADDVIGTLAREAASRGEDVVISSGDKDLAQLVCPHVVLMDTMKGTLMGHDEVVEKFGVGPEHIIDLLALMGDSSDNIPGVAGVGPKTAVALIQGLGGIEQIYQQLDKVADLSFRGAKTMAAKLREHEANARLSYQLATIKTDVDHKLSADDLRCKSEDRDALVSWFGRMEFKRWLAEYLAKGDADTSAAASDSPAPVAANTPPAAVVIAEQGLDDNQIVPAATFINREHYQCINNNALWQQWQQALRDSAIFAFDCETSSLDYMQCQLVGLSFSLPDGQAAYLPLGHDYLDAPQQLTLDAVLADLVAIFANPASQKVAHNAKFDLNVLRRYGIEIQGILHDTMLQSYVLNSTATRHGLDQLALKFLQHDNISFEDVAGSGVKQLTFNQVAVEQAVPYAAEDADVAMRLQSRLWAKLLQQESLLSVYQNLEQPLLPVLARMERAGVLIDAGKLQAQSVQIAARLAELESQAHELAGQPFNLSSTKQLQEILFDKLQLPVLKKTPKGAPSTNEEVLQELALDYPLPQVIMEHRGLSKLKSTYTDKLPLMIDKDSGRVHTSYHQAVTATGRLSSSDPNLQNIPIRTEEGRRVRQAFVAPAGYKIVAIDYSQIELRIMAHLSGDAGLVQAFAQDADVHRATAAEVFGVAAADVSSEQRRRAKAINFGLIYGMSAFGLARQLGIARHEAQGYMDVYFERYPGVLRYMEQTRLQAEADGYVQTLCGRRLYLPEINNRNMARKKAAERAAINAPMQGTAADIIKLAMLAVDNWIQQQTPDQVRMLMQVHDELVFEVAESAVDTVVPQLKQLMEQAIKLSVPLVAEAGIGDNWDQAH